MIEDLEFQRLFPAFIQSKPGDYPILQVISPRCSEGHGQLYGRPADTLGVSRLTGSTAICIAIFNLHHETMIRGVKSIQACRGDASSSNGHERVHFFTIGPGFRHTGGYA